MNEMNPVERAFQLARGGDCGSLEELKLRLKQEGFASAAAYLASPSLRKQLVGIIRQTKCPIAAE